MEFICKANPEGIKLNSTLTGAIKRAEFTLLTPIRNFLIIQMLRFLKINFMFQFICHWQLTIFIY